MSTEDDTPRKTPLKAARPKQQPPGGKRRDRWQVEDLTDQVAALVNDGKGNKEIASTLGRFCHAKGWAETSAPLPSRTVVDYVNRANERNAEYLKIPREILAARAVARAARLSMQAAGAKSYSAAVAAETLRARIEGTEAASVVLVDRLVEARFAEVMEVARSRAPAQATGEPDDAAAPAAPATPVEASD